MQNSGSFVLVQVQVNRHSLNRLQYAGLVQSSLMLVGICLLKTVGIRLAADATFQHLLSFDGLGPKK